MRTKDRNKKILSLLMSLALTLSAIAPLFLSVQKVSASDDHPYANLLNLAERYIVVRKRLLGGSHYAYTEAVSDDRSFAPEENESRDAFRAGTDMQLVTVSPSGSSISTATYTILNSGDGVIRDPDVSPDGKTLVFSWKRGAATLTGSANVDYDDYHLYTMDLTVAQDQMQGTIKQLTFGSGVADTEPKYLPDGSIVFSSTRDIQTVDCWKTPVSNLYICDADGGNIRRVGFDQVHTTYPTVTADGRVLYTRWDYNDRTQMFVQGVMQMNPDGTNQTELFGNNSNFPTTLLHTAGIPGSPSKYVSIASGHHNRQAGKLVILDTAIERNDGSAIELVVPSDGLDRRNNIDVQNVDGLVSKYPVAINENEFLVSRRVGSSGQVGDGDNFNIQYINRQNTALNMTICAGTSSRPASQIVPITSRDMQNKPAAVDYSQRTGTVYIGDVYEGDGLKDISRDEAKYIRVVALEYRPYAIGINRSEGDENSDGGRHRDAHFGMNQNTSDPYTPVSTAHGTWDVKVPLGVVPIEADGSALFKVPADTPIYYQVLNERGEMIQSMRSWMTLMPGETFSCVGCHEPKNTAPPVQTAVTMAMQKGPQEIGADLWMTGPEYYGYSYEDAEGFSYRKMVQPILDKSCVECHNNTSIAETRTGAQVADLVVLDTLIKRDDTFKYMTGTSANSATATWMNENFNDGSWSSGRGPFASADTPPGGENTTWNAGSNSFIFLRNTFNLTQSQYNSLQNSTIRFNLNIAYDENPIIYINGQQVWTASGYIGAYQNFDITGNVFENLKEGTNTIAVRANNTSGGAYIGFDITLIEGQSSSSSPISFMGNAVVGQREKMFYTLSYLVLTNSIRHNDQFRGAPSMTVGNQVGADVETTGFANWISGMSQPEMLPPYRYGSSRSRLMRILNGGHSGRPRNLTQEDLYILRAWMDLGVPLRGAYDEGHNWATNAVRESEEALNKRNYYDMADAMTKKRLGNGGTDPVQGSVKIEWINTSNNSIVSSAEDTGLVKLALGNGGVTAAEQRLTTANRRIRVTLPENHKYFYFNLNTRLKEALIYAPSGVFEYTVPSSTILNNTMPFTLRDDRFPIISARLPSVEELATEKNLALNPYDLAGTTVDYFPRASSNSEYDSQSEYRARNAIDGFKNNKGHGGYPVQSWGPHQAVTGLYFQIDFGRPVRANKIALSIRADFPHDKPFENVEVEFSDGSRKSLGALEATADTLYFDLGGITTEIMKFHCVSTGTGSNDWAGFTEVEVFGVDEEYADLVTNPQIEDIIVNNGEIDNEIDKNLKEYAVTPDNKGDGVNLDFKVNNDTERTNVYVNGREVRYSPNVGVTIPKSNRITAVDVAVSSKGPNKVTNVYRINVLENYYTVKFMVDNEPFGEPQRILHGNSATAPSSLPPKEGHDFSNWDTDDYLIVLGDIEVHALYRAHRLSVHFMDGETLLANRTVDWGRSASAPAVTSKPGFTWKWSKDFSRVTEPMTGENAVFLIWEVSKHKVTIKNGDEIIDEQLVEHGQDAIEPTEEPTKPGFIFGGWDGSFVEVTEDRTINVIWTPDPESGYFGITYMGLEGADNPNPEFYVAGAGLTLQDPGRRKGYVFAGWYDAASGGNMVTAILPDQEEAKTLYARWTANGNAFALTYNNLNGADNPNPNGYTAGETVVLQDPDALEGYVFEGWFTAATGGNRVTAIRNDDTGDKTFYARWTANENAFTLTYNNLNGAENPNPGGYTAGSSVVLQDPDLRAGFVFDGWFDSDKEDANKVVAITETDVGNKVLYARWAENEDLLSIVYINLQGAANSNPFVYIKGKPLLLQEPGARAGYVFNGWFTAMTGGDKVEIIPEEAYEAIVLYARWTENANVFTISYAGLLGAKNPNPNTYISGEGIDLVKPENRNGFVFDGWYSAATGGSEVMAVTETDTGNLILYARWREAAENEALLLTAEKSYGQIGARSRVPVKVTNNSGLSAFEVIITYDSSVFTPTTVNKGGIWQGETLLEYDLTYGKNQILVRGETTGSVDADGILFEIVFEVDPDVSSGSSLPVFVQVLELRADDEEDGSVPVPFMAENSTVVAGVNMFGDAGSDGKVSATDATLVLLYVAGRIQLDDAQLLAADVNMDGVVNAEDASEILKLIAGKGG